MSTFYSYSTTLSTLLLLSVCSTFTSTLLAQQGIKGQLTDHLEQAIIGGTVQVFSNDNYVNGTSTDFDGNYTLHLDPGTYKVKFSYIGYSPEYVEDLRITKDSFVKQSITFTNPASAAQFKREGCILRAPPIDVGETTQGMIIRGRELRRVSKPN